MIGALAISDVISAPSRTCAWPGCDEAPVARGYCDPHRLRVQRGREPGCETAWEQLVVAALRLADASDADADAAEAKLKAAARAYVGRAAAPVVVAAAAPAPARVLCSGPECRNPARVGPLCDSHYRQQKAGKPLRPIQARHLTLSAAVRPVRAAAAQTGPGANVALAKAAMKFTRKWRAYRARQRAENAAREEAA